MKIPLKLTHFLKDRTESSVIEGEQTEWVMRCFRLQPTAWEQAAMERPVHPLIIMDFRTGNSLLQTPSSGRDRELSHFLTNFSILNNRGAVLSEEQSL